MAPQNRRRNGWHQVSGKWTRSLGERGCRVRLFEKRRNGTFYREMWISGSGYDRRCLGTKDRETADRLGRELLAGLLRGEELVAEQVVTLGQVWDLYRTSCAAFLDNKPRSQRDYAARAAVLIGFFGEHCEVATLTERDQAAFVEARRCGGIQKHDGTVSQPVHDRSVEADLALLHMVLRWATTYRLTSGTRLLDRNPLEGVRRPRERNPRRPVATWERFVATRQAIIRLQNDAASELERVRWIKMELALVLAEATGRRLSSIRQLKWEDCDLVRGEIRWRADADKKGREWIVPLPEALVDELRTFKAKLAALGGWVFPGERKPHQPMDRHLFDKWLTVAEQKAGLPKLSGGLWHPYRRKWKTERKHLSLTDVAEAGGWRDLKTMLTSYDHPDRESLLAVMAEPKKLRDRSVMGGGIR